MKCTRALEAVCLLRRCCDDTFRRNQYLYFAAVMSTSLENMLYVAGTELADYDKT